MSWHGHACVFTGRQLWTTCWTISFNAEIFVIIDADNLSWFDPLLLLLAFAIWCRQLCTNYCIFLRENDHYTTTSAPPLVAAIIQSIIHWYQKNECEQPRWVFFAVYWASSPNSTYSSNTLSAVQKWNTVSIAQSEYSFLSTVSFRSALFSCQCYAGLVEYCRTLISSV